MSTSEAKAMPGGATGLFLFLLGSAAVFLSGAIVLLSAADAGGFGSAGWIIPLWGFVALVLAVVSRKQSGPIVAVAAKGWLVIGTIGLAMIMVGSNLRLG